MINQELNKKMNHLDSSAQLTDNGSFADTNLLLNGLGSNGTIHENSNFNLDEIHLPINLNFTQSVDGASQDIRNTPAVTQANTSINDRYPDFETKQKHDSRVQIISNPSLFEHQPEEPGSAKNETNKAAKSLEKFVELEKFCSMHAEESQNAAQLSTVDPTTLSTPAIE